MARIETYEPSVRLDVPGAPNLPASPRQPALGAGAAAGEEYAARALSNFGGAVQNFGADVQAHYERKQAEAEDMWFAKARAETVLNWPAQEQELQAGSVAQPAMGVGGAGVVPASKPKPLQDRTKAALEGYSKKLLAGAPSPRAASKYTEWFAGFGAQKQSDAFEFDQHRQEVQKKADFIAALDTHTRLVSTDPSAFGEAWSAAEHDLASAAAWMPADQLATLRATTRSSMELARAKTLAINDPLAFQREAMPDPGNQGPENPRKASTGWIDNPLYSHLDGLQVAALLKDANSTVVEQHNAAVNAQTAETKVKLNDLLNSLLPGGSGRMTDILEARKTWLTNNGDIVKAIDALDKRDKGAMNLAKAQALFTTGHQFSFAKKEDRDAVDLVYDSQVNPEALIAGDQHAIEVTRGLIQSTGIVPEAVVDTLRAGMVSRDKNRLAQSYTVVSGLYKESPAAVRNAFPVEDLRRMDMYANLAVIVPPEELQARLDPSADPKTVALRDKLEQEGKALAAKVPLTDILAHFESSMPFDAAGQPMDGTAMQALLSDYQEAYAVAYAHIPNQAKANELALTWIAREKWGTSEIGAGKRMVAFPPERHYDTVDGSHDWMDQQIEDLVQAQYPGAQDYGVMAAPETEGNLKDRPPYNVWVLDKNGALKFVTSPEWQGRPALVRFDHAAAVKEADQRFRDAQGSLIAPPPGAVSNDNPLKTLMDAIDAMPKGKGPMYEDFKGSPRNPMGRQQHPPAFKERGQ